jgi:hypothetical protein
MSVAHEPPVAVVGQLVGMDVEQGCNLGLDSLHQQRSRTVAQNLGQRIGKSSWLGELDNISLLSLLALATGSRQHWRFDVAPHDRHGDGRYERNDDHREG